VLFTPALISVPVRASRLVRKFEARPIAAQPRLASAPATGRAGPCIRVRIGRQGGSIYDTPNARREDTAAPHGECRVGRGTMACATELWARPAEIHGLLDRLTLAQPVVQRDTTVPHDQLMLPEDSPSQVQLWEKNVPKRFGRSPTTAATRAIVQDERKRPLM
jgi:hypothetical protein